MHGDCQQGMGQPRTRAKAGPILHGYCALSCISRVWKWKGRGTEEQGKWEGNGRELEGKWEENGREEEGKGTGREVVFAFPVSGRLTQCGSKEYKAAPAGCVLPMSGPLRAYSSSHCMWGAKCGCMLAVERSEF